MGKTESELQDRSESRVRSGSDSVRLVSLTPDAEETILYCARVSSNQENKDAGLLNYLVRNGHWSPFEMAHAVIEITTSRAIAAQILRHRSFSFQEHSQRYASVDTAILYSARKQASHNRQSSTEGLSLEDAAWWASKQAEHYEQAFELYNEALDRGIARECARFILPLATQTRLYVSGSIRSWIHYFEQRCDEHAQLEHRLIAEEARRQLAFELPVIAEALGWPR